MDKFFALLTVTLLVFNIGCAKKEEELTDDPLSGLNAELAVFQFTCNGEVCLGEQDLILVQRSSNCPVSVNVNDYLTNIIDEGILPLTCQDGGTCVISSSAEEDYDAFLELFALDENSFVDEDLMSFSYFHLEEGLYGCRNLSSITTNQIQLNLNKNIADSLEPNTLRVGDFKLKFSCGISEDCNENNNQNLASVFLSSATCGELSFLSTFDQQATIIASYARNFQYITETFSPEITNSTFSFMYDVIGTLGSNFQTLHQNGDLLEGVKSVNLSIVDKDTYIPVSSFTRECYNYNSSWQLKDAMIGE